MPGHSPQLVWGSTLGGFLAETCLISTLDSSPKLVWGQRWIPRRNLFGGQRWAPRRNLFGGQCWAGSSPKLVWGQRWVSCRNLFGVNAGFLAETCLGLFFGTTCGFLPGRPPFFNPAPLTEAVLGSAFSSLKSRPDSLLNQVWGRT